MRYEPYDVPACPRCGEAHRFAISIREKEFLFGGAGETGRQSHNYSFVCPKTKLIVTEEIEDPSDGEIVGPADIALLNAEASSGTHESNDLAQDRGVDTEFTKWMSESRATAIDFCTTMLTATTGAIPIYFGIMKYVGATKADASLVARIGIVPPLLFLAAAAVFFFGLRPSMGVIDASEFKEFRKKRLLSLDRYITTGSAFFAAGILFTIVLLFWALL